MKVEERRDLPMSENLRIVLTEILSTVCGDDSAANAHLHLFHYSKTTSFKLTEKEVR